jgi:hypothetical protein
MSSLAAIIPGVWWGYELLILVGVVLLVTALVMKKKG